MTESTGSPVVVEAELEPKLSRWLWLVKWLLLIPHYIVLLFLWIAFVLMTIVAFFAILITGRYPRAIFDFNAGVIRWGWRVAYYSYGALGTDKYPPFSLGENPEYPARVEIAYPEKLSRGLVLVKWWLLAIPHYLVIGALAGGSGWAESRHWGWGSGGGVLGILVLIVAVLLLFTDNYPRTIFDFVMGINRWVLRVVVYATLMTDRYPPFRIDLGGADPARSAVPQPAAD